LTGESTSGPDLHLGIVGTGAIACGLARLAAGRGARVALWARSEDSAERARTRVTSSAYVPAELVELVSRSVDVDTELDVLGGASTVIEAIVEDASVKTRVHERLGETLPPETVMATTTSSLPVSELAEASGRPDRFAALHVFNPVEKMQLVELAFPAAATAETRRRLLELCELLDKTAVEVPDTPGFVVNRLLFPYLFSAVRLLEETGLAPEAIDDCMKLGAGHPMGPLALLDFVGLDVATAIGESIGAGVPGRVRELVAEGQLGRKSGAGFYSYE
jgi:3-hydroxyacyl-CoA dehydrogenase